MYKKGNKTQLNKIYNKVTPTLRFLVSNQLDAQILSNVFIYL